jgi:ornithine cyclodeaminase/alanine dehydrogenase-like protein (mu-crystallin family)
MTPRKLRFLSAREVAQALPMREAVAAMKEAFRQISGGEAVVPPRTRIETAGPSGDALFMLSYAPAARRMGVKVVTLFAGNVALGLPRLQAIMLLLDAATGSPLAVMDGAALTAIRTGAASPSEALAGADVVCTATTPAVPVFADRGLAPGVHINAVGSYKPAVREVAGETVRRARVVVDSFPAALAEAGDLIIPMQEGLIGKDHIYAELGEIVAGKKRGRESRDQVTLFKSVGVALQDLFAAAAALTTAERLGLGTELTL